MGFSTIILIVVGIAFLLTSLVYFIKIVYSPVHVMDKYADTPDASDFHIKKYKEADQEYYRKPMSRLGLIGILGLLIAVFNYVKPVEVTEQKVFTVIEEEIQIDVPNTQQVELKAPPPPPPPQIVIVENTEILEEEPEIADLDVEIDDVIEIVEIPERIAPVVEEVVEEPEDEPEEPEIFTIVEENAQFPGGMKQLHTYLAENIQYPPMALENDIVGRVVLRFVVNEEGSISDIQILRDIGGGCAAEAIRVVKSMPKWVPAKQRGRPVKVYFTLPVKFELAS